MASRQHQAEDRLNGIKMAESEKGQRIATETREVQPDGSSNSPRANLSRYARDVTDIHPGDTVEIEIYREKLVIRLVEE
jgi:hypothetical protein